MNQTNDRSSSSALQANVTTIFIFDAKDGMTLSSDVISPDGTRLASADTKLDLDLILKISNHHILEINVYKPVTESKQAIEQPLPVKTVTYFDKVRQTESYHSFNEDYVNDIRQLKDSLNDIILRNLPINSDELLVSTKHILEGQKNNLVILDMLHSMRNSQDATYAHCVNVSLIATVIGKWMNFSQNDIDVLTLSGLLHDVGKLLIPKEIILKPGRLNSNEYKLVQEHVRLGYEHLKDQDIDQRIKEACLFHHERCDGTGYPLRLKGDEIPPFAKIIAIADVYDAMTDSRTYREPICPFDVVKQLNADAFTKYDPNFMIPFLKNVVSSYIHNNVELSDGQIGEVIMIQDHALSQPIVKCGEEFIDLSKRSNLRIVRVLS